MRVNLIYDRISKSTISPSGLLLKNTPKIIFVPVVKVIQRDQRVERFMSDALVSGCKLRILKVVDDCTRESLAVWCDYSIPGEKVNEIMEQVIQEEDANPSRSV